MRTLAGLLVALVLGVALAVAAFAALHALKAPTPETAPPGSGEVDLPASFEIAPEPFDRTPRRLARAADANHKRRFTLRGQAGPEARNRLISLWRQDTAEAPLAIEKVGADGTFVFGELQAGSYFLRGHGANEVQVRLEADTEVDLRPRAATSRTISIVAELPAGVQPLGKAQVLLERDGRLVAHGQTDAAGRVALDGVRGKLAYRVWASLPDDVSKVREWQGEVEAAGEGEVVLRLRPQDAR